MNHLSQIRRLATALMFLPALITFALLLLSSWVHAEPSFEALGTLGGDSSTVTDLSEDGASVVGSSSNGTFTEAYVWSLGTMTGLGDLGGQSSQATAISADLSTIVGRSNNGERDEAFVWNELLGMRGLGHTGAGPSVASGVSADGTVVVGTNGVPGQTASSFEPSVAGDQVAFRWREDSGIESLGFIEVPLAQNDVSIFDETILGSGSGATGVSADGETIFGNLFSYVSFFFIRFPVLENVPHGFTWTETDGFTRIIPGGSGSDIAGANGDLSVLVGDRLYTQDLGDPMSSDYAVNESPLSFLFDSSADGSLLAGTLASGNPDIESNVVTAAALENIEAGALKPYLFSIGLDVTGWNLTSAESLSADGRVIAGNAVNPMGNEEGWVVQLDEVPAPATLAALPDYFYDGLTSAVLPSVRTASPGQTVTVFASIANTSDTLAVGCRIGLADDLPVEFDYHRTDPTTNETVGLQNIPVDIPAGETQSFVIGFTPEATFPATDLRLVYDCENGNPALFRPTLNSVRVEATDSAVPDVIALVATNSNDGVIRIANRFSANAFAIATANVGATGQITVRADVGDLEMPVNLLVCETDTVSGQCNEAPASEVTLTVMELSTATFAVFVNADLEAVEFRPDINRVFVRFFDESGEIRGATSVALTIAERRDLPFVGIAAVTPTGGGILELPANGGESSFAVSVSNSNVPETVTVSVLNPTNLPVDLEFCQTDEAGICISERVQSLEHLFEDEFDFLFLAVFANATGEIPLSDRNRVFVTVTTPDGAMGERSVQVTTEMSP